MKWIDRKIKTDFEILLDTYKDFIYQAAMKNPNARGSADKDPEDKWIGLEYLKEYLSTDKGAGGPKYCHLYMPKHNEKQDPEILEKAMEIDNTCKLKLGNSPAGRIYADFWGNGAAQYYPPDGYMSWHDNFNAPGWNILFTWSEKGDGFFRWYDIKTGKIETMFDRPGWSAKIGYYGGVDDKINDPENIVPHCCKNYDNRFTFGWMTMKKEIQDQMLENVFERS